MKPSLCFGDFPELPRLITGDGAAIFRHACWMDLEGIVSKRIGSRYVSDRTRAWLKYQEPRLRALAAIELSVFVTLAGGDQRVQ